MYKDFALLKNGFPMESVSNGSVLVVKTHEWGGGGRKPFDAAMLLIRYFVFSSFACNVMRENMRLMVKSVAKKAGSNLLIDREPGPSILAEFNRRWRNFTKFVHFLLFSTNFLGLEGTSDMPALKSSQRREAACGRTLCAARRASGRR